MKKRKIPPNPNKPKRDADASPHRAHHTTAKGRLQKRNRIRALHKKRVDSSKDVVRSDNGDDEKASDGDAGTDPEPTAT